MFQVLGCWMTLMWELKGQFSSIWSVRYRLLCVRSHAYIPQRDFCRGQSETVARMVLCLDNAPLLRQRYVTERRRKRGESSWTCVWGQTVKAARHARFAQNDFL